jgi:WD40 repeat protein
VERLGEVYSEQPMHILQGHRHAIRALAYAPGDPPLLGSAGDDRTVQLWDPVTRQNLATLEDHRDGLLTLSFSADRRFLASGGRSGSLAVWDVGMRCLLRQAFRFDGPTIALGFSASSETLFAALRSQQFAGEMGQLLRWHFPFDNPVERLDWVGDVESAAFSPSAEQVAVADQNRSVELWQVGVSRQRPALWLANRIRCLAFSPCWPRLLAVASGRVVELWEVGQPHRVATCQGHRADVTALAFAPDGLSLLTGSADRTVRLWDVPAGQERAAWDWQIGRVNAVALSSDGMTAAAGGEKAAVVVWDIDP